VVSVEVKHPVGCAHGDALPTEGVILGHASHRDLGLDPGPGVAHGVSAPDAEGVGVIGLARIPGLRLGRVRQPAAPAAAVHTDLHVIARHAGTDAIAGRPGDGDAGRL
jgi:hypothetical protein